MKKQENISKAKQLIRVIRDTDNVYEPLYRRKCAKELLSIADVYPESYYHLAMFDLQYDSVAEVYCQKGIEHNDISCTVLTEVWKYNDSVKPELEQLLEFEQSSVFDIYAALANHYNKIRDTDKYVKYLCLAYDAEHPSYIQPLEIRILIYPALYKKHKALFEKYASKRLLNVLQTARMFSENIEPDNVSDEIIFSAYMLTKDKNILWYLMTERKYVPAFEEAFNVYGQDALTTDDVVRKNAIELKLPYLLPYCTKSLSELKKIVKDGNLDAINEIARSCEGGLIAVFGQETAEHYAMMMVESGYERFHWSVTETLWSLRDLGKEDIFENDYINYVYGRYRD